MYRNAGHRLQTPPRVQAKMTIRKLICACLLTVIGAAVTSASDQPSPRFQFDLSSFLTGPRDNIHMAFIGDDRLLVTTGEIHANGLVFNLNGQHVEKKVSLNCYVDRVWPTASGNLVVFCRDQFTVYDKDLQILAKLPLERLSPAIEVSPSGSLFALNAGYWGPNSEGKSTFFPSTALMQADSLKQLQPSLPDGFGPITDRAIMVSKPDGLYLSEFAGAAPKLLARSTPNCLVFPRVLGPDRILAWTCHTHSPVVVNLDGTPVYHIPDLGSLSASTPSTSGDCFLLAFEGRTWFYALSQLPTDLLGADERSDLAILQVYDEVSGKCLFDMRWKLRPGDPVFGSFDEGMSALSPSGKLVAAVRGKSLEVYDVPKN
jgi:hypothetical protein